MIDSQENDVCGADNRSCTADNRKSSQNFRGDSPKLKKARHTWQVKNKPPTVADDRKIHSQPTIAINGAQQHEGLQENESCSDSVKPCCSYSASNDRITHTACSHNDTACSRDDVNDIAKSNCDLHILCLDGYNRCETEEVDTAIDGASDDQNITNCALANDVDKRNGALHEDQPNGDDSCNLDFAYTLDDSAKSDPSVIILVPQFNTDSTDYPSAQNLVTRSIDPNDPLRYVAMPTGKWLLECSLMRAELDNDINKALERLRYFADQSAQWTQRTYISKRISLESAGIFQVIEEQGLRTASSSNSEEQGLGTTSSSNSEEQGLGTTSSSNLEEQDLRTTSLTISPPTTLRPYCEDHTSAVENTASASTSTPNDTSTKRLRNYIVERTDENGLVDVTMMSDLCSTSNDTAASFTCPIQQSNSSEPCSDLTTINELTIAPSSSFIIDQAVSAVIVERGIHL